MDVGFLTKVPEKWKLISYPSLKSLANWYKDLKMRVAFIEVREAAMDLCFVLS